jgi:hypothetical protein
MKATIFLEKDRIKLKEKNRKLLYLWTPGKGNHGQKLGKKKSMLEKIMKPSMETKMMSRQILEKKSCIAPHCP